MPSRARLPVMTLLKTWPSRTNVTASTAPVVRVSTTSRRSRYRVAMSRYRVAADGQEDGSVSTAPLTGGRALAFAQALPLGDHGVLRVTRRGHPGVVDAPPAGGGGGDQRGP